MAALCGILLCVLPHSLRRALLGQAFDTSEPSTEVFELDVVEAAGWSIKEVCGLKEPTRECKH